MANTNCLTSAQLEAISSGLTSEKDERYITKHTKECEKCRFRVEQRRRKAKANVH